MKPSPAMLLRSLNGSGKPLAVLFAMLISGMAQISEAEIAVMTGNNAKTVRTGLRILDGLGFVTRTQYHHGWTLTVDGQQMLLSSPMLLPTGYPQYGLSSPQPSATDLPDAADSVKITEFPANPVKITDSLGKNYRVPLNNRSVKLSCCIDSEDDLTTTTAIREKAQKICAAVESLGWEPIWPNVVERIEQNFNRQREGDNPHLCNLDDLLGWIAHCYENRQQLRRPASVVAANIMGCRRPARRYRDHPGDYLPAEFLESAGLAHLVTLRVEAPIQTLPLFQEIIDKPKTCERPAAAVTLPIYGQVTPQQAWETVIAQLQTEMPKSAFDSWVQDTWCCDYDPATATFIVAARDDYARQWLDSRLTSAVARLLTGIVNQAARVQFVNQVCAQTF